MMIQKLVAFLMTAALCCSVSASEVSQKKIRTITQIVQGEYRKMVVVPQGKKARPWQYADNPRNRRAVFAKIRGVINKKVPARVKPFVTKAKQDSISRAVRTQINKSVAKRFPYKTSSEIAMGALKEAELAYPLVKVGDDVTIRYHRGGLFSKASGKIQSIRDGGKVFEINNKLIRLSEIVKDDRQYFDPVLNGKLRQDFIDDFQDPKKYAKFKRDYAAYLMSEELEKVVSNEKKGYIFYDGKWVTAQYITDQLIKHYEKMTERRLKVEQEYFVRGGRAPVKKKK